MLCAKIIGIKIKPLAVYPLKSCTVIVCMVNRSAVVNDISVLTFKLGSDIFSCGFENQLFLIMGQAVLKGSGV